MQVILKWTNQSRRSASGSSTESFLSLRKKRMNTKECKLLLIHDFCHFCAQISEGKLKELNSRSRLQKDVFQQRPPSQKKTTRSNKLQTSSLIFLDPMEHSNFLPCHFHLCVSSAFLFLSYSNTCSRKSFLHSKSWDTMY